MNVFFNKGVTETYFSSYVILMLCNFKIGTDPLWYKYYIYTFSWHESSSSDSGVLLWHAIFHLKWFETYFKWQKNGENDLTQNVLFTNIGSIKNIIYII